MARRFANDAGQFIRVTSTPYIGGLTTFTWLCWARRTGNQGTAGGRALMSKGTFAAGSQCNINITKDNSSPVGNAINFFYQFSTTSANTSTAFSMVLWKWYFIVASVTGTTAHLRVGAEGGQPTLTNNTASGTGTHTSDAGGALYLGADASNTSTNPAADIAYVQIYNRELGQYEANALMNDPMLQLSGCQFHMRPGYLSQQGHDVDLSGHGQTGLVVDGITKSVFAGDVPQLVKADLAHKRRVMPMGVAGA